MPRILTPAIGRRRVVAGLGALATTALVRPGLAEAATRILTPAQTEGPFYPVDWTGDIDNDLVVVQGEAARAQGHVTHILGRVLDASGNPIRGAKVEIWQCDAKGVYRHPRDESGSRRHDGAFQGRGRTLSGDDGAYAFRTIRPVAYPGRTPHIHFAITAPGHAPIITQMYVEGEPGNARDFLLNAIRDERQRAAVIVKLEPGERLEAGALVGTFDVVLG